MVTSSHDLLRIHHRYPLLGFLLALCNPSTIPPGLSSLQHPSVIQHARDMMHSTRSNGYNNMIDRFFSVRFPGFENKLRMSNFAHDLILHLAAIVIVALMIGQAVFLGIRGVIVFACWTWHEPFTWVGIGGLIHLLSAIAWRLCLGPIDRSMRWSRWHWSLSRSGGNLTLAHLNWARFSELLFQIIGLMNYGYGTVILSATTLVTPTNALMVFFLIGFASMSSRLLAIWLLEVFPEVPVLKRQGTTIDNFKGNESERERDLFNAIAARVWACGAIALNSISTAKNLRCEDTDMRSRLLCYGFLGRRMQLAFIFFKH